MGQKMTNILARERRPTLAWQPVQLWHNWQVALLSAAAAAYLLGSGCGLLRLAWPGSEFAPWLG